MASESTTSNVLLTGQSAYVKKNGSMVNHGTIERQNALTAYSINTEGYIGPNSVLHGTDLAETTEYEQCEAVMKSYLGENWEEDPQERTIITNSNKIKTMLLPGENNMATIANNIMPDYQECNYIYWYDGTQYFNTGINGANVYGIEFTFRPYSTVTNAYSSLLSGVLDNFTIGTGGTSGTTYSDIYLRWRTIEKLPATTVLPSFNARSPITIAIKNGKCKINNTEVCDIDTTQAVSTATGNIYIGNNSALSKAGNLYFHSLKLYGSESELLVDMIPIYSNNTYCIYDKVSNKIITNSGTGSVYGSTKTEYKN